VLLHARALANTGSEKKAAAQLSSLVQQLPPGDPVGDSARNLLAKIAATERAEPPIRSEHTAIAD